jgi:hypothetical protein
MDAIEGNLAAARGLRVIYLLVFTTLGLICSTRFDFANDVNRFWLHLFHQAYFARIAAAGLGILSLVGYIPMVPGSIAAKSLVNLFALLRARLPEEILSATNGIRNLLEVALTLAAIETALAIPRLIYPPKESTITKLISIRL